MRRHRLTSTYVTTTTAAELERKKHETKTNGRRKIYPWILCIHTQRLFTYSIQTNTDQL